MIRCSAYLLKELRYAGHLFLVVCIGCGRQYDRRLQVAQGCIFAASLAEAMNGWRGFFFSTFDRGHPRATIGAQAPFGVATVRV